VDDALVGITNVMVVDFGRDTEVGITRELSFSCVVVGGAAVEEVNLVVVMRTGVIMLLIRDEDTPPVLLLYPHTLVVPQYWSPL
jgi:hypothetical protein